MDLEKLAADLESDPALAELDQLSVAQAAKHLRESHKYLVDPVRAGPLAYLYRKQIERNRALQQELDNARNQFHRK